MDGKSFLDAFNGEPVLDTIQLEKVNAFSAPSMEVVEDSDAVELLDINSLGIDLANLEIELIDDIEEIDLSDSIVLPNVFEDTVEESTVIGGIVEPTDFSGFDVTFINQGTLDITKYEGVLTKLEIGFITFMYDEDYEIVDNGNIIVDTWNHNFSNSKYLDKQTVLIIYLQIRFFLFVNSALLPALMNATPTTLQIIAIPYRETTSKDIEVINRNYSNKNFNIELFKKFALTPSIAGKLASIIVELKFNEEEASQYSQVVEVFEAYVELVFNDRFIKDTFDNTVKSGADLKKYVEFVTENKDDFSVLSNRKDYIELQSVLKDYQSIVGISPYPIIDKYVSYEGLYYIIKASKRVTLSERFVNKYLLELKEPINASIGNWYSSECTQNSDEIDALGADYYNCILYNYIVQSLTKPPETYYDFIADTCAYDLNKEMVRNITLGIVDKENYLQLLYVMIQGHRYINKENLFSKIKQGKFKFNQIVLELCVPSLGDVFEDIGRGITVMLGNGTYQFFTVEDIIYENTELYASISHNDQITIDQDTKTLVVYTPINGIKDYKARVVIVPPSNTSLFSWACLSDVYVEGYGLDANEKIKRFNLLYLIKVLKDRRWEPDEYLFELLKVEYDKYSKFDRLLSYITFSNSELISIAKSKHCGVLLSVFRSSYLSSTPAIAVYTMVEKVLGTLFKNKFASRRDGLNLVSYGNSTVTSLGQNIGGNFTLETFISRFNLIYEACIVASSVLLYIENDHIYLNIIVKG